MSDLIAVLDLPGFAAGLVLGGFLAYFVGVRDPFSIAAASVLGGIAGLVLDVAWIRPSRRRRKVG